MQEVKTIQGHFERQATPEVWAEVDELRDAARELLVALDAADSVKRGDFYHERKRLRTAIGMETRRAETLGSAAKP